MYPYSKRLQVIGVLLLVVIGIPSRAQFLFQLQKPAVPSENNAYFPDRLLLNPVVPDVTVYSLDDRPSSLSRYVSLNRRHPDKPLLIVTAYTICNGCIDLVQQLRNKQISSRFDVFVVVELLGEELLPGDSRRAKFFEKEKVKDLLDDVKFVYARQTETQQAFLSASTPLFLVCDANGKPFYSLISLNKESLPIVIAALELAEQKKAGREMIWLDQQGKPVAGDSKEAIVYYAIKEEGNRGNFISGGKSFELYQFEYLRRGSHLYYDGRYLQNYVTKNEDGSFNIQPLIDVQVANGYPQAPYRSYYEDGKLNSENLLNGTFRQYDRNGRISLTGQVRRGVGEGEFRYLRGDTLIKTVTMVDGQMDGLVVEYDSGKVSLRATIKGERYEGLYRNYSATGELICERYMSPDAETVSCLQEGLSRFKSKGLYGYLDIHGQVIIAPKYTRAYDFQNGRAEVYIGRDKFYIDKEGKRIH